MSSEVEEAILHSFRRIARAMDVYSRHLSRRYKLTCPQLLCLRQLAQGGPMTAGDLADRVALSQATVTGILSRMEQSLFITRHRSEGDRRRVMVCLTEAGQGLVDQAPLPLQQPFVQRLASLAPAEQRRIASILDQVVLMMERAEDDEPS